ncbi:tetratricopeptide repeat protein [Pelotomaculum isophthalicicum JI]|uniref:Tetratricopeptide repeat protein n=1 Tax=Pelotomaculum isophthalicicum JI TaxID=947010 RepID=A0A9X4JUP1_9FIRM|nr:tetratricopeptide repeat protein [Pelotomaculum isophthalicicum]MDF9409595.1 tetratricopeptide repeat protein [Pelotomaculum isophthalicicum JI]
MKLFGIYMILSLLTGNPLLSLVILLLIIFFAEQRFVGILPDFSAIWRRKNKAKRLKKEIRLNPANAEACLELGEIYFRRGKYEQALSFLENASDKMAGHPLFHFYLGASYYNLGKIEEGKKELEKAIEANPKVSFGEPYLFIIRICLEEKQSDAIIDHFFHQLLLYGSPKTFYQAGKLFLSNGDRERARLLFRETIEIYDACRGALRRFYRRWAVLSKIALLSMQ